MSLPTSRNVRQMRDHRSACPACGDVLRKVGEDVTGILDYVPGRFEMIRHAVVTEVACCRYKSMEMI